MHETDYQLLKELALEFIRTRNPSIFTEIIKKVDRLLLYVVYKARKKRYHLRNVELQDLYHSTIVGLHQALLKVKEDDPGSKIITKIVRYANNEIVKDNKIVRDSSKLKKKLFALSNEDKLVDNTLVYKNLEMEFIRERFLKLIDEGVISFKEFEMITMRFVNDMAYREIAAQFGISRNTTSKMIKNALCKMKNEFIKRDWEEF